LFLLKYSIKKFVLKNKDFLILLIVILLNVLPNSSFAAISIENYVNLDELKTCLRKSNFEECQNLILLMEKLQIEASNKGNFRCQSTLLGIQTELIKNLYFKKNEILPKSIIQSNLIKNC
tara:strand:+ start:118 stop:477 length:360 start_codon:yes stop_codon:yes gene_type:complete